MNQLRIINRTRGTVVGSRVALANNLWSRLRGFLGRPRPTEGEGILLVPCNAIHTFGMKFPLDVLFLDAEGQVLHMEDDFPPWKTTKRIRDARYVLEVPAGTAAATRTQPGDDFTWMPPRSGGSAGAGTPAMRTHDQTLSSSTPHEARRLS